MSAIPIEVPQRRQPASRTLLHQDAVAERPVNDSDTDSIHVQNIQAVAQARDKQAFSALYLHFAPRLKAYFGRQGAAPQLVLPVG